MAKHFCDTKRFLIFKSEIERPPRIGKSRDVYQAWFHSEDVPKPVCVVTLNSHDKLLDWCDENHYLEWIHVDEQYRRRGVATEVINALVRELGDIAMEAATDAGEAFCNAYLKQPR